MSLIGASGSPDRMGQCENENAPAPLATAGGVAETEQDGDDVASVGIVEAAVSEVLDPGEPTLAELAATINHEHSEAVRAGLEVLEHVIRAGDALLAVRQRCTAWGEWVPWVRSNLNLSITHVQVYMRIARYKDELRAAAAGEAVTSIKQARRVLRGLPPAPRGGDRTFYPEEMREVARELHAEGGMSFKEIASELGVHHESVRLWTNPDAERRNRERCRQRQREVQKARRALKAIEREQAIKRAVKKAGAATQEVYAMAERMQDVLAQAHRETEDREARQALSLAGEHHRKMRDEIVRALGVA